MEHSATGRLQRWRLHSRHGCKSVVCDEKPQCASFLHSSLTGRVCHEMREGEGGRGREGEGEEEMK